LLLYSEEADSVSIERGERLLLYSEERLFGYSIKRRRTDSQQGGERVYLIYKEEAAS